MRKVLFSLVSLATIACGQANDSETKSVVNANGHRAIVNVERWEVEDKTALSCAYSLERDEEADTLVKPLNRWAWSSKLSEAEIKELQRKRQDTKNVSMFSLGSSVFGVMSSAFACAATIKICAPAIVVAKGIPWIAAGVWGLTYSNKFKEHRDHLESFEDSWQTLRSNGLVGEVGDIEAFAAHLHLSNAINKQRKVQCKPLKGTALREILEMQRKIGDSGSTES